MKYRDEIHIALMALVFSCAMFAVYAVVPKNAAVAARAKATVKEAPETAAEAEALRSSQDEDAGFNIYTEDNNYDDSSDSSDSSTPSDDDDEDEDEDEDDDGAFETSYEVTCPNCGTVNIVDEDTLMDSDKIVCAECGAAFDVEVLPDDAEMPADAEAESTDVTIE